MSTRLNAPTTCYCIRCARARRLENLQTIAWSAAALICIYCGLWGFALIGVRP